MGGWHIPCPRESEGLITIIKLKSGGLSYPQIASELDRLKVKPKTGKKWMISSIHKILNRNSN